MPRKSAYNREYMKRYYQENKERLLVKSAKRYEEKGDEIRKKASNRVKANPEKYRPYFRAQGSKWEQKYPGYHAALNRRRTADYRALLISAFGGKCYCCGETIQEFLTLDHIKQDGKYEREKFGKGMYSQVAKLGFPKDRYRLACMNCNWVERKGAICPHKLQTEGSNPPC